MKKYLVIVRLNGQLFKTAVYAESSIHARLLVQYVYGMHSVVCNPTPLREDNNTYPLLEKLISSKSPSLKPRSNLVKPKPPQSPAQERVNGLKLAVAQDRLKLQQFNFQERQKREAEKLRNQRQSIANFSR